MERINTYEQWLEQEGLPVIKGYCVPDLMAAELRPWKRKGGLGAYVNLAGAEGTIDVYLCEIPPGKQLLPQRHLYEETIYILSGHGATAIWVEGGKKQTFEWQEGSLFAPPLNVWHQHFNTQGDKPVRYVAATKAPVVMNLFHDLDFIFHNDHIFKNRYSGESDYFSGKGQTVDKPLVGRPKVWDSNFIPDCRTFALVDDPKRGGLSTNCSLELSNNIMRTHLSEFRSGTYMKAHYHGPGAHLLCMNGMGYTLLWPTEKGINSEGFERTRVDWKKNSIISVPGSWFHQHFNPGREPIKFVAFHAEGSSKYTGLMKDPEGRLSVKLGGTSIDYEDEDPAIRKLFKEELAKNGASFQMSKFFPGE